MRHKIQRYAAGTLGLALMLCLAATPVPARQGATQKIDNGKLNEATEESKKAAEVFREIMSVPEKGIPRELLDQANAVAVFPNVVKAAFIIGGRGGDGVISRRFPDGTWSAPAFFNIGGASFGAQIGAQSTDYVLLIMNEGGLKGLLEDKFEFGGEASVAAGPVGRTVAARTNATLDAGILSYSRSQGAFIGASIQGAVVNPDNDLNEAIYGMKARGILTGEKKMTMSEMPAYVRVFPQTLARYSTGKQPRKTAMMRAATYRPEGGPGPRSISASMTTTQDTKRSATRLARAVRNELLTLPYYSVFDWLEYSRRIGNHTVSPGGGAA